MLIHNASNNNAVQKESSLGNSSYNNKNDFTFKGQSSLHSNHQIVAPSEVRARIATAGSNQHSLSIQQRQGNVVSDLMRQTKIDQMKRFGMSRVIGGKSSLSAFRNMQNHYDGTTNQHSSNVTTAFSLTQT